MSIMTEAFAASWLPWALLSAVFAALTAVFAKVGVADVNPDMATFIRTIVILAVVAAILVARKAFQPLGDIGGRSWLFLCLSGAATGASWLCYFRALQLGEASRVAPVDKLSVVLVAVFGAALLGEHLAPHHWAGVLLIGAGAALLAWT
jgi:transporter family protein